MNTSPIGEVHLGRLDSVPQHVIARGLAAGLCCTTQDSVLGGSQTQIETFGLDGHEGIVHRSTYKRNG